MGIYLPIFFEHIKHLGIIHLKSHI